VAIGVDGTEASEIVLEFGFEHGSRHRVPVRAVLCRRLDLLATMSRRPAPPAPEGVEAWLGRLSPAGRRSSPT
jgi:hypothetical protein